jgi:hypothetical protein
VSCAKAFCNFSTNSFSISRWNDYELPYNVMYNAQGRCPRFSIFKRFIDTFKYSPNVRFVLRSDDSLTIEADADSSRHFTIFSKIKVMEYPKFEKKYKGPSVSALVDHKKVSQFIHSVAVFHNVIKLCCMIQHAQNLKLLFRFRDDIIAHYIIPTIFDDDDENRTPESGDEVLASDSSD